MSKDPKILDGLESSMTHTRNSFFVDDAIEYGVEQAAIIEKLAYLLSDNFIQRRNIDQNGRVWTYNSIQKWLAYFPYFTAKQMRTRLDKLVDSSVLMKEVNSPSSYQRDNKFAFVNQQKYLSRVIATSNSLSEAHRHKVLITLEDLSASQTSFDILSMDEKLDHEEDAPTGGFSAQSCAQSSAQDGLGDDNYRSTLEPPMITDSPKRANALDQSGASICPEGDLHSPRQADPFAQTGKCLQLTNNNQPTNNPNNNNLCASIDSLGSCLNEPATEEFLTKWFEECFWPLYLPLRNKDKKRAFSELIKLSLSEAECDILLTELNIEISERSMLEEAGQLVPAMPYAKTWLKDERWKDGKDLAAKFMDPEPVLVQIGFKPNENVIQSLLVDGVPRRMLDIQVDDFVVWSQERGQSNSSPYASYRFKLFIESVWRRYKSKGLISQAQTNGFA